MAEETAPRKIALDDLMLAMDVVDTLRHRRSLAEREMGAEDYDRALIEKVRKVYADQGLEVSESVIAAGVAALREERFSYKPPRPGLAVTLARLYVRRGAWGKWAGIAAALFLGLWLAYQAAFVMPADRAHARRERELAAAWESFQAAGPTSDLRALGERVHRQARADLDGRRSAAVDAAVRNLEALALLPPRLDAWRGRAVAEALEKPAAERAETLYRDAMAALGRGDAAAAEADARDLEALHARLMQAYELRIVSRPGSQSGVWRHPADNPAGRNYYVIVEAVGADGRALSLPVTSEEDGRTQEAAAWGIRVGADVFEQVRRDKADNGIVDRNRFGVKVRGRLEPEYLYPTTGEAITEW